MMVQDKELITLKEAVERFGISDSTFRAWIMRRQITTYRRQLERRIFVDANEIARKLEFQQRPAVQEEWHDEEQS